MYSFDGDVESNALNVHIHHLRRKPGNGIIDTVRGAGYRLGPPPPSARRPSWASARAWR